MKRFAYIAVAALVALSIGINSAEAGGNKGKGGSMGSSMKSGNFCAPKSNSCSPCKDHCNPCWNSCFNYCTPSYCSPCYDYCYTPTYCTPTYCEPEVCYQPQVCYEPQVYCQPTYCTPCYDYCTPSYCTPSCYTGSWCNNWFNNCHKDFCKSGNINKVSAKNFKSKH